MSWYSSYKDRSIGRVLHFLEHYCGLWRAEVAMIGGSTVNLGNDGAATYVWYEDEDGNPYPHFTFSGRYTDHFTAMQRAHLFEALNDK